MLGHHERRHHKVDPWNKHQEVGRIAPGGFDEIGEVEDGFGAIRNVNRGGTVLEGEVGLNRWDSRGGGISTPIVVVLLGFLAGIIDVKTIKAVRQWVDLEDDVREVVRDIFEIVGVNIFESVASLDFRANALDVVIASNKVVSDVGVTDTLSETSKFVVIKADSVESAATTGLNIGTGVVGDLDEAVVFIEVGKFVTRVNFIHSLNTAIVNGLNLLGGLFRDGILRSVENIA